jgi:hypothetical protein
MKISHKSIAPTYAVVVPWPSPSLPVSPVHMQAQIPNQNPDPQLVF